jgi:hypothetical protein
VGYFVVDIGIGGYMVVGSNLIVDIGSCMVLSMVGYMGSLLESCCYPDISLD